ncbi:MAG: zinc ribbon-containing protein [Candidatus Competibacteraceae bacterium]
MSEPSQIDKLIQAYNRMMERVKIRLEELEAAEKDALPRLRHGIEHAMEKAVELGELSREEAQRIGAYLKRDLQDAGYYLATTGKEIGDWLRFDLDLVEDRLLDLFSKAADKTSLDRLQFEETLAEESTYQAGEITGPGTLQCDNCGERLAFHATSRIPVCPGCAGTRFSRVADEAP